MRNNDQLHTGLLSGGLAPGLQLIMDTIDSVDSLGSSLETGRWRGQESGLHHFRFLVSPGPLSRHYPASCHVSRVTCHVSRVTCRL